MSIVAPLPPCAKGPFLVAAGLLLGVAGLIACLAIRPPGWADVIGIVACVTAAAVFVTIPFVVDFVRRLDAVGAPPAGPEATPPTPADLAAQVAALVDAHLAAALPVFTAQLAAAAAEAEEKRRAEVVASVAATTPPRALDTDAVPSPVAGAKPRLGRGLLGLMHAPGAINPPGARTADSSATDETTPTP